MAGPSDALGSACPSYPPGRPELTREVRAGPAQRSVRRPHLVRAPATSL